MYLEKNIFGGGISREHFSVVSLPGKSGHVVRSPEGVSTEKSPTVVWRPMFTGVQSLQSVWHGHTHSMFLVLVILMYLVTVETFNLSLPL